MSAAAGERKKVRIIPRLEIKGRNVVKGIRMEGLRVVGQPEEMMDRYFLDGADEIIFEDTVASLYGRNQLSELLSMASESIFVPLAVGGGVRGMNDFHTLLRAGADKVTINTYAFQEPELLTEAAKVFGSQCVVVSIQAKRKGDSWVAFADNGRQPTRRDAVEWAREVEDRGAGEILLTSVDNDGTRYGPDLGLIKAVTSVVRIPVIACGGTRSADDVATMAIEGDANAVGISNILHFGVETIASIKAALPALGVDVRPADSGRTA